MADILKSGTVDSGFKFIGGDPSSPTSWEPEGLKIGTVDEGYRFLGGDPASKDSWSKMDRSYIGAAAESGGRSLLAAGAKLLEEFNPFTTSEQDAAVLFKDNPEKLKEFTEKSAASVLSRFAQEQTRRAEEAMKDVNPAEKGLISGEQIGDLEYATLDPEKAAYLSPTRVAGDVLQSLPTTLALAVSAYLTKGRSLAAAETAEANALARGLAAAEAKQVARTEAIKVAADTMAKTGAIGEGALGYAVQANEVLKEAKSLPDDQWEKSPEFRDLVDKEGYSPESAKVLLSNKAAEEAGVYAGAVDAATNLIGGKILGNVIGEGGKLGARAAKGFATEAATETVQSAGEQLGANIAAQTFEPTRDLTKGVLEAAVAGGVVGGVTGGGAAAVFGSRARPDTDILNDLNNAKDVDSTIAVANELAASLDELTAATTEYLKPTEPSLTPDESIELAAAKGAMDRVGSLDLSQPTPVIAPPAERMAAAETALREVEANEGVATPAQAAIIDAAFPGRKMYDEVSVPAAAPLTEAGVIEVPATTTPRETIIPGATEAANAEGFAELQARQQAEAAAAPTPAAPVEPAPPVATTVIQAFATPAFQRTPEQRITLNTAQQAYPAEDLEVMQLAATAPFRLDANQKLRLQTLRQAETETTQGPTLSTTRPEGAQPGVFPPTAPPMGTVPEAATVETRPVPAFTAPEAIATPTFTAPEAVTTPTFTAPEAATVPPLQQQEQPAGVAPAPQAPLPTPTVDSAFVAQMASSPEMTFTPDQVRVVDPNELQGTARQTARLINQIGRVFGKQVVMFDGLPGVEADGFVNPQARDTIFLNTKSTKPHLNVFGHELFHLVKQDAPEIYRAFASVVERNLDEQGRAAFKADYGNGANIEEISSDLIGNRFSDPVFWTDVFSEITQQQPTQKAQGVVARLAGTLYAAVDRMVGAIRGQGFKADEFVKDLQSIKTAARSAMIDYAKVRKIPAMQMEAEVARTKQFMSQQIQGEQNVRPIQSAARGNRPELGTDWSDSTPTYGQAREGAVSARGVHYSTKERAELDAEFYGGGLTGVEKGRVYSAPDKRLRNRIYFYVKEDGDVKPELGVGDYEHRVNLNNLYDPESKLIPPQPNANAFESAVLDAGFDGYINRNFEGQSAVVLLGERKVPVAPMGKKAPRLSPARKGTQQVEATSGIENAFARAREGSFNTNRELKTFLQDAVRTAAGKKDLTRNKDYLVRVGVQDALYALKSNANAVGWYDSTVTKALNILATLHPEIATDPNAKFAFTWALAVTSNGLKVDKNFELAEAAYRSYKENGVMPTNIQAGQAQKAINESMALFNEMVAKYGIEDMRKFMSDKFKVSQIERVTGVKVGGEFADTEVRGAAILGPKIGNGFFSNLNGFFDQLTMDRWLMRTWGRWTGTLIEPRPDMVKQKRDELASLVREMKKNAPATVEFQKALGRKLGLGDLDELAQAIQKASVKPENRTAFNKTAVGENIRKVGNGLAKYLDGQKEAPAGPEERNFIREVFGDILKDVRQQGYEALTMSDLQALLWYPEKRLYDVAKSDEATEGYQDDEAPDYANAAAKLARDNGVSEQEIKNASTGRTERDTRIGQAQAGAQERDVGFAPSERKAFLLRGALRSYRDANASAQPYSRRGDQGAGRLRVLGQKAVAQYTPETKFKNALAAASAPAPKFFELSPEGAALFSDSIKAAKDASPFGAAVYVYPEEDYRDMRLFLTEDGKSGFAIKGDDIVSVFSTTKGSSTSMLRLAVQEGGRRLDAFDTALPDIYAVNGFKVVARLGWNDEYRPADWNKATFAQYNNGEPDVVFMVYDPSNASPEGGVQVEDYDAGNEAQQTALAKAGPTLSRRRGGLESIFEGLNGKGLTLARAETLAKQHPAAAEIAYVQDNFYDILSELEDSGRVTINCD